LRLLRHWSRRRQLILAVSVTYIWFWDNARHAGGTFAEVVAPPTDGSTWCDFKFQQTPWTQYTTGAGQRRWLEKLSAIIQCGFQTKVAKAFVAVWGPSRISACRRLRQRDDWAITNG
jgi:hypothetical protein